MDETIPNGSNAKVKIFCGAWKCPILFANSITGVYYLQTTWHILRVDFIQFWDSASCRNTEVNSASILPVGSFNFEVLWSSSLQHHKKCKGLGFNVQSVLITYPSGFNVLSVLTQQLANDSYNSYFNRLGVATMKCRNKDQNCNSMFGRHWSGVIESTWNQCWWYVHLEFCDELVKDHRDSNLFSYWCVVDAGQDNVVIFAFAFFPFWLVALLVTSGALHLPFELPFLHLSTQ